MAKEKIYACTVRSLDGWDVHVFPTFLKSQDGPVGSTVLGPFKDELVAIDAALEIQKAIKNAVSRRRKGR